MRYRGHDIKRSAYVGSRRWFVQRYHTDGETPLDETICPQTSTLNDAKRVIDDLTLAEPPIKRLKDTGRKRTILGTDWPILHRLEGSAQRGFSVDEDLCDGDFFKRTTFTTLKAAGAFFARLEGEEV